MSEEIEDTGAKAEDVKKGWFNAGIITIALAFVMPFIIMLISSTGFTVKKIGELGAVGDFFGGSTIGLLSIASIFFIIHTINIQSKELSLQRKELELTRTELKDTRKVHEKSNETMNIQRFETTFFNLLTLHNDIVDNIKLTIPHTADITGRKALAYINNNLRNEFIKPPYELREEIDKTQNQREKLNLIYVSFFKNYGPEIGHYFRNLYRIMKFIDKSSLELEEKKEYIGIMRAQLSTAEFRLIFYNCVSFYGEDFKELVLKYNFFDGHLDSEVLIRPEHYEFINE